MNDTDYMQILKWVLIVLAAGFIGQFGKSLATYLIKKAKNTRTPDLSEEHEAPLKAQKRGGSGQEKQPIFPSEQPAPEPPSGRVPLEVISPVASEDRAKPGNGKAEKKAAKAAVKLKKKENKGS